MNDPLIVPFAAALAAIAGAWFTYKIAERKASGLVANTDADRLWEQNSKLIGVLTLDNTSLRLRIDALVVENEELRRRFHSMEQRQQQTELAESECNDRADRLTQKVSELERRINGGDAPTEHIVVEGSHLEVKGPEPKEG